MSVLPDINAPPPPPTPPHHPSEPPHPHSATLHGCTVYFLSFQCSQLAPGRYFITLPLFRVLSKPLRFWNVFCLYPLTEIPQSPTARNTVKTFFCLVVFFGCDVHGGKGPWCFYILKSTYKDFQSNVLRTKCPLKWFNAQMSNIWHKVGVGENVDVKNLPITVFLYVTQYVTDVSECCEIV